MTADVSCQALTCVGLGRRFGRRWAVAHVDLTVAAGDSLLLTGPNGSGKSTLLRLAAGLLRPSQGSIAVFGHDPCTDRQAARSELCLVSHYLGLYPRLTAAETVDLWQGLGDGVENPSTAELLRQAGLGDHADLPVGGFSAGMRKRLALARARVERPHLLLLDEPFSALDAEGREWLLDWLRAQRAAGTTLVLASHDLERGAQVCDRAVRLQGGQVAWCGPSSGLTGSAS